jgi:hypothetical protein
MGDWHLAHDRPTPEIVRRGGGLLCQPTAENPAKSLGTSLWNFHGSADQSVPVALLRDRIATLRKAGGHPLYTDYVGVDHHVWEWAYTEPAAEADVHSTPSNLSRVPGTTLFETPSLVRKWTPRSAVGRTAGISGTQVISLIQRSWLASCS